MAKNKKNLNTPASRTADMVTTETKTRLDKIVGEFDQSGAALGVSEAIFTIAGDQSSTLDERKAQLPRAIDGLDPMAMRSAGILFSAYARSDLFGDHPADPSVAELFEHGLVYIKKKQDYAITSSNLAFAGLTLAALLALYAVGKSFVGMLAGAYAQNAPAPAV